MAVEKQFNNKHYGGLESEKPSNLPYGDTFFSSDIGNLYKYNKGGNPILINAGGAAAVASVLGWELSVDGETTPTTQVITTVASKLSIDGSDARSNSDFSPLEIRGISNLWDTTNDKINIIKIGDGYELRLDFEILSKTGSPQGIDFILDIGGQAAPTVIIVERIISTGKAAPYRISLAFPFFGLETFKTNGGQIFLKTDTGTVTIGSRQISIHRISSDI